MSEKKSKIKLAKVQRGLKTGRLKTGNLNSHRVEPKRRGLGESPYSVFESFIEVFHRTVKGGGGATAEFCPFGEVITIPGSDPPAQGIRGGVVHCGDQNWNFDPQEINLAVNGIWLVYLDVVDLEVNRDDDGEILMPGVKTGTKPTGDWGKTAWSIGTDYPENTEPVASTGIGSIILPLGKLTIADGAATFERAGCGNFTITHCAGTLGYTRQ